MNSNLITQDSSPVFPDVLWSKPERKDQAGHLLIIGGHSESITPILESYALASSLGAGKISVAIPEALKKSMPGGPDIIYCDSTTSGSLSKDALPILLQAAQETDMILLPGAMSNNSQSFQLLERLLEKIGKPLVVSGDSLHALLNIKGALDNPDICAVLNPSQLQHLVKKSGGTTAYTSGASLMQMQQILHDITGKGSLLALHNKDIWTSTQGRVSKTKRADHIGEFTWQVPTATACAVYWMHNPDLPFEAFTTASLDQEMLTSSGL